MTKLTLTHFDKEHEITSDIVYSFFQRVFVPPLQDKPLPIGTRFSFWQDTRFVLVHETPPMIRRVSWIGKNKLISLPYTVLFVTYGLAQDRRLVRLNYDEIYFSYQPIRSLDDPLYYPALLNVSPIKRFPTDRWSSWVCALAAIRTGKDWLVDLEHLYDHIWNGRWNNSSERNEGDSWYSRSRRESPTKIPTIEDWVRRTSKNALCGLDYAWLPAPTVRTVADGIFTEQHQADPNSGRTLAQLYAFAQKAKKQ